ncbi:MAG TPA: hypothetical protein VHB77_09645 [Planctomycetaceae bacterium]|nr:hypothetical protein [Planctomycetaceae bacterium]
MADATPHEPTPADLRAGHETTDANAFKVAWTAFGLVVLLAVVHYVCLWLFGYLHWQARQFDQMQSPLAQPQEPPPPRLQKSPETDYVAYRDREQRWLATYGWIDPKQGVVHLPVERAMQLVLERGVKPKGETSERDDSPPDWDSAGADELKKYEQEHPGVKLPAHGKKSPFNRFEPPANPNTPNENPAKERQ